MDYYETHVEPALDREDRTRFKGYKPTVVDDSLAMDGDEEDCLPPFNTPSASPTPAPVPFIQPAFSRHTIQQLQSLTDEERATLKEKLRTHLRLCVQIGAPIENLERFIVEGIEVMRVEAEEVVTAPVSRSYWPEIKYHQYVSPRDL
jgi:hypothetical protein